MIWSEELDELKRRLAEAQPGPWFLDGDGEWITAYNSRDQGDVVCERPQGDRISQSHWSANAALILAMHESLPKLIAEIEALHAARDAAWNK